MSGPDGARRAVAYIRLEKGDSVESVDDVARAQRAAIEEWAGREQVAIRSWQLDLDVSDKTPIAERPGLLAAYAAIREHRAGILVAANAERFSVDELVSWLIERAALTQGAKLQTADGSQIRTPADAPAEDASYSRGALDLARTYQRVVVRSRIRAALAAKKSRGERAGAVPYGYRLAADGVHLEPNEAEQAVVASVRQLASEGLSQRAIVAHLATCGVTGRTGAPLRQTQVARILRSA
ncbi:MAG TPA: recombinase family protein [Labilithrix sp.]|nr:recombinase family protein [Labilithrix sp.]